MVEVPYAAASSTLLVTVQTGKPSYYVEENINVHGYVAFDGIAVQGEYVALEVHDPADNAIIARTLETSATGIYSTDFMLTAEAPLGIYTVHVSCTHNEVRATNGTSFQLEQEPILRVTVRTSKSSYRIGENINIQGNTALQDSPLPGAYVALEVQDLGGTPVVVRVRETQTDGSYQLTFQMPTGSKTGNYTVHASVSYERLKAMANATFQLRAQALSADINGDGKVDIRDITVVAMAFGSEPGDENWNQVADLNNDEIIDIRDITIVAMEFGKTY